MTPGTIERDPDIGCGYCTRVHEHLIEDGEDLVCAPGYGCAAKSSRRRSPVLATKLPRLRGEPTRPATVRVERDSETCACGNTHATNESVWGELVGGRVEAFCPMCAPQTRPGGVL